MRRNIVDNGCPIGIAVLLAMLSLWSCSGSDHSAERVVKEWLGKEIVFPDSMVFTVQGDTVDYNWQDAEYKIVTFVDSAGCTECRLKLPMWLHTYEMMQADTDIALIMVISTTDTESITDILSRYDYPLPVYIDTTGLMESLNPNLTASDGMRTFLLDTDNKVVTTGNPIDNRATLNRYSSTIRGDYAIDEHADPKITSPMNIANLGVVKQPKSTQFLVHNPTDSTAVISKILVSCDCVRTELESDTIPPHGAKMLTVTQMPDSVKGEFIREVILVTAEPEESLTFTLRGFMP